jgi:hypothetical protein
MPKKREFQEWLREHDLSYALASADDFYVGAELLVVDLLRKLDPKTNLYAQATIIRIEGVRANGTVYYRHHPVGKELCFVPVRNFLIHEMSVVVKSLSFAEVIQMKTASR